MKEMTLKYFIPEPGEWVRNKLTGDKIQVLAIRGHEEKPWKMRIEFKKPEHPNKEARGFVFHVSLLNTEPCAPALPNEEDPILCVKFTGLAIREYYFTSGKTSMVALEDNKVVSKDCGVITRFVFEIVPSNYEWSFPIEGRMSVFKKEAEKAGAIFYVEEIQQ